jgi:shikimate kinase/peroxiredoxin family protein
MTEPTQSKIQNPESNIGAIFLVGFMGSGKTTVGRLLAERLHRRFIDLDDWIVERAGKPITRIFGEDGEEAFRQLESELLREVAKEQNAIISLGGGAFVSEANRRVVKVHGVSVWLDCSFDMILKRLEGVSDRPLNRSPEQLRQLLESRLQSYSQADIRIDTGQVAPTNLAEEIITQLRRAMDYRMMIGGRYGLKKVAIIVSRGSFNNLIQVATLIRVLTSSSDTSVRVFFRDEALLKLTKERIHETNFSEAYRGREEETLARLRAADFEDLQTFLREAKEHGDEVTFLACASSMYMCGLKREDLIPEIDALMTLTQFWLEEVSNASTVMTF